MTGLRPVVRYLIACEDIQVDPNRPRKVTLVNVISAIDMAVVRMALPVAGELIVAFSLLAPIVLNRAALRAIARSAYARARLEPARVLPK